MSAVEQLREPRPARAVPRLRGRFEAVDARLIVYSAVVLYGLVFAAMSVLHFAAFRYARVDLGTMTQAVWSTAHGNFLQITTEAGRQTMRFAIHVDPFLALLAPFWRIWPSPLMLLVVQALGVSAGALPVYWLGRKHLGSGRAAAHFAIAYLLYPATQFNTFTIGSGFHALSMAIPLVLFAIWFLDEDRLLRFAAFALLAISTKEEVAASVGCLGVWYAVRKKRRFTGGIIFVTGVAVSVVDFLVVIPHYTAADVNPFRGRYAEVGGTPTGIAHKAITDPGALIHTIATGHKLLYVILLLVPFAGLWLLEPLLLLGAVPDLAINLLSSRSDQTIISSPRTAGLVPFIVAASVLGAARLRRNPDAASMLALVGAACLALYSPLYFAHGDLSAARSSVTAAKTHALALIPSSAPVAASNQLGGYVSGRRFVYSFPYLRAAQWAIIDRNDPTYGDVRGYRRAVKRLQGDTGWKVVYDAEGIEVFRKVGQRG